VQQNKNRWEQVLNDPASTPQEKELARQKIGSDPVQLEAELTAALGKPLMAVDYLDVHTYCTARGWNHARALFDKWLTSHFRTAVGRRDLARAVEYLRQSDFEEWDSAMIQWRESEWKPPQRLIAILELIADSVNRGNYHDAETVENASQFLAALQRRAGIMEASAGGQS
jgi:hypothetical protein